VVPGTLEANAFAMVLELHNAACFLGDRRGRCPWLAHKFAPHISRRRRFGDTYYQHSGAHARIHGRRARRARHPRGTRTGIGVHGPKPPNATARHPWN